MHGLAPLILAFSAPVLTIIGAFPVAHSVKNLLVQSLGWEDPLEKEMAAHSRILAWEIWTEEIGGLQSMGLDMRWQLNHHHLTITENR